MGIHPTERGLLVHGDPHPANAVLREWCSELLAGDAPTVARRYCHLLASHTSVDEQALWEWGFLERVSSGL